MKTVISCSRRTDVLAFYYDWLQNVLSNKKTIVKNPYSGKDSTIDLSPENIHSIVLWSKNYDKLLKDPGFLELYNLYFQFTITGYNKILEPNVPHYKIALKQVEKLAKKFSPEQISWRFDPIIFSSIGEWKQEKVLADSRLNIFKEMCEKISSYGVTRCTISFLSLYGKVLNRMKKIDYLMPDEDEQCEFIKYLVEIADKHNMQIYSCSSPIIEKVKGVKKSSCIDGKLLSSLFSEKCSKAKSYGQRNECGCTASKDIADYTMKCSHSCRYCYANPKK